MKLTTEFGRTTEKLQDKTTRTFDVQGRLLSTVTTDAAGKVTSSSTSRYEGTLLAEETELKDGKTTRQVYEYVNGATTAVTKYDAQNQVTEVRRYTSFPNGYQSATFGKTGPATLVLLAQQDERGRVVRSEGAGANIWMVTTDEYSGDRKRTSTFASNLLGYTTAYLPDGQRSVSTYASSLGIKDPVPEVQKDEQRDARGNPTVTRVYDEITEFGAVKLRPTEIEYHTYEYH